MSVVITITLITNQYGANPWNTAHIEGKVEYPPSPWRILRSILAGYYLCPNKPAKSTLDSAIYKLSQARPNFYLPPTSYTQHRYYRKDQTNDENLYKGGRKVIEPALRFHPDDNKIWVEFPGVVLSSEEEEVLDWVLFHCRYLGRSEYLADWQLVDRDLMPKEANATPNEQGTTLVLSPILGQTADELIENLNASPRDLRYKLQTDLIPGSEWVSYSIYPKTNSKVQASFPPIHPKTIRFQLLGIPLPRQEDSLMWAERLHQALVGKCASPNFTGKGQDNAPLKSAHTYIYPEFNQRGYITHLNCYSPLGFAPEELKALLEIKSLWSKKGNISLIVESLTSQGTYQPSRYWQTITPFFLSLYPKFRKGKRRLLSNTQFQDCGAEHQALRSLLSLHLNKDPRSISYRQDGERLCALVENLPVAWCTQAKIFPKWYRWKNVRQSGENLRGAAEGYYVMLELAEPFEKHLSIGYGAYFGLGTLSPMREWVGVKGAREQNACEERHLAIY